MNKKDYPLAILEALQTFVTLRGSTFEVIGAGEMLLKVIDNDNKSPFYFNILDYKKEQNVFKLLMERKPRSRVNHDKYDLWIETKDLEAQFKVWIDLLDGYNKIKSFFDDPILDAFSEEFFTEFEMVDEDDFIKPLNTANILLLDEYLNDLECRIDGYQNEKNEHSIKEIKQEILELRENLAKPKAWIAKKLSKIWAKIAKQGPKFIKDFLIEGKKQLIIEGVKALITQGKDLII